MMIFPDDLSPEAVTRRKFLRSAMMVVSSAPLLAVSLPIMGGDRSWTVGEIMDMFIKEAMPQPLSATVDTLKTGDRDIKVKGIVTTMFATIPVIRQAISLGANFIIAHEPTFYNHEDNTDWLKDDETFKIKRKLLDDHHIAVWRNHDYIHSHKPDGVFTGLLEQLGWKQYAEESTPWDVTLPKAVSLSSLIDTLKQKLDTGTLRYIGDGNQQCKKILLMPGAAGGRRQISAIAEVMPDVAIVGELQEWETAEYIRDARAAGKNVSLIVLGHIASEDAGSAYMKQWLNERCPGITVTHVQSGNAFRFR